LYRLSPNGTQFSAPANAITVIDNVLIDGFLEITPDATSGIGVLSVDVALPEELKKLGLI